MQRHLVPMRGGFCAKKADEMTETILIENGNVLAEDGAFSPACSVLLNGDNIVATGAAADQQAGQISNVTAIDATGLTVMPGLIDAHCHISFDEVNSNDELFFHRDRPALAAIIAARNVQKVLRAGVTSIFDADSIHELSIDLRDGIEANVVAGPRIKTGGYALLTSVGGTAGRLIPDEGIIGYGKIVRTHDEIVIETRRQIKAGVDWIKVHVTGLIPGQHDRGEVSVWSFEELELVCKVAHDLGVPVVGHCRGPASVVDAARAGFDMILHATLMDDAALEAVVERKIPIVPTFTFQANLIEYGDKVGADPHIQDVFRREISDSAENLKAAFDAGVPLLSGSESGFSVTPYGEWHHKEMEVFVRDIGLTPVQAIQTATINGAKAMKMEGEIGAIKKGLRADIICIDGDPTYDVSILGDKSRLKHVIARGRQVDLTPPAIDRSAISGWRTNNYGQIMTQDFVGGH